ncbi:MAG: hypothetical protein J5I53_08765 [Bradyrhizobiaceae bacterium]|nr:hypothetical protein [Bradyrhizobiaceae bacterium]
MISSYRYIAPFLMLMCIGSATLNAQALWNPLAVDVTRSLTRDLFENNAVPYVQPMVTAINATSNARFYDAAYVPEKVDKPYFRVSVHGMMGKVTESMKWYTPTLEFGPRVNVVEVLARHGNTTFEDGKLKYTIKPTYADTLGLTTALVKELLRDGLDSGYFSLPDQGATLFGYLPDAKVGLPSSEQMTMLLHNRAEYLIQDSAGRAQLDSLLGKLTLPSGLTLPPGVNLSSLIAAVPQVEVGSLFGTEALIRFVPPVQFDKNIGRFAFWGFGLRHSLSQYFPDRWFDLAAQAVYQGTSLKNTVGFTKAELDASARIWSANIHASKELWGTLAVYSGVNWERIDVTTSYTYALPQEVQIQLGLLPDVPIGEESKPTPEQPGDTKPQTSTVVSGDTNVKWTIGATAAIGNLRLAVDYSMSNFNIFTAGLSYTF